MKTDKYPPMSKVEFNQNPAVLVFMQPPGYAGGSAYFDDVNLTKTSVMAR